MRVEIVIIFVTIAGSVFSNSCFGQASQEQNNPFAPLGSEASLTSVKPKVGPLEGSSPQEEGFVWEWDESQQHLFIQIDGLDIRKTYQHIAKHSGFNIILDPQVEGIVYLHFKETNWKDIVNAVAQTGGYFVDWEDHTCSVVKAESVYKTEVFHLKYSKARDIETVIKNLVSKSGKVAADYRLNSIVVKENILALNQIRETIANLDVAAEQILVDVFIINVNLTDEFKMGIDWSKLGTSEVFYDQALSATAGLNPSGTLNIAVTPGNWDIAGLMDFIKTHDSVSILANPRILVLNNQTATIESVKEIPYRERTSTSAGGDFASTSFRDVGIKLLVTPQVTHDGHVILHVIPEQSAQVGTFTVGGNNTPVIETRKTETHLQVEDGQTIIIAGLRQKQPSEKVNKIPFLGDLPLIGALFRRIEISEIESELAVFITPHICSDTEIRHETSEILNHIKSQNWFMEAEDILNNTSHKRHKEE